MAHLILVHGAWHGGWCWERVTPLLEARGHRVSAPDLPGMGADADSGVVATVEDWAGFVTGIARGSDERTLLVGHSRGGIVVSAAAQRAPNKFSALVYVTAALVPSGRSMGETLPELARNTELAAAAEPSNDGRTSRWRSRALARSLLYGRSDDATAEAAFARLGPEPASVATATVTLSETGYGRIPRFYVACRDDALLPLALQQRMADDGRCTTVTIDADHSPFYSAPSELADALDGIALAVAE